MAETFNIYCDESSHLENDHQKVMVLGAVWCPLAHVKDLSRASRLVFEYEEGTGKVRTYLWGHTFDYVVVLEKISRREKAAYMLITAFHVDGDSSRRRLRKKYEKRCL